MKLVIAIVQNDDAHALADALRQRGYAATMISTTGGFLRKGNASFLIGVEEKEIETLLAVIQANSKKRTRMVNPTLDAEWGIAQPVKVEVGGAVVFILDSEQFGKF